MYDILRYQFHATSSTEYKNLCNWSHSLSKNNSRFCIKHRLLKDYNIDLVSQVFTAIYKVSIFGITLS